MALPPFSAFTLAHLDACEAFRRSQSRYRAFAHVVAAREFGQCGTLRTTPAGLGLLRVSQSGRPAHVLAALLRPAPAFGGAGAD
jgi:hypothetical protein